MVLASLTVGLDFLHIRVGQGFTGLSLVGCTVGSHCLLGLCAWGGSVPWRPCYNPLCSSLMFYLVRWYITMSDPLPWKASTVWFSGCPCVSVSMGFPQGDLPSPSGMIILFFQKLNFIEVLYSVFMVVNVSLPVHSSPYLILC